MALFPAAPLIHHLQANFVPSRVSGRADEPYMSKRTTKPVPECQTLSLAQASRILGISLPTATKILERSPADLPPVCWIGRRRYVLRSQFQTWLDAKVAGAASAIG
jgi:helix-turn-helix protein